MIAFSTTVAVVLVTAGSVSVCLCGYCWYRYDEVRGLIYASGAPVEPAWKTLRFVFLLLAFVLFIWGLAFDPPKKSEYQIVQDRVNACLKVGGTPIVTDAGTSHNTWPHYWGCKK